MEWSSRTRSERIWNLQRSWKISYVSQRIDLNPRMYVAQCRRSSVVVAKEKIVQRTMLERWREHSKHALPSTEDRAPPPLKYQNISTRITQATTSSLKIRRYWIEIKLEDTQILDRNPNWFTGGVREAIYIRAHKPTLNRDGGRYNLLAIRSRLIWSQVTWPVKSHQQWSKLQLELKALNRTSSCVVSKIHNFWLFVKLLSCTAKLQSL